MEPITIHIQKDSNKEFRVPSPEFTEAGAYYTGDKQDAIDTAKKMHGQNTIIKIKSVQEHKEEKLYILSRPWLDKTVYVANLPGEGNPNSDYGYVSESKKAKPLSEHWKRRFMKYCQDCGTQGRATAYAPEKRRGMSR